MADYSQPLPRPNIKPSGLPPSEPPIYAPAPTGWGVTPALGAVAVVGIVALVAWGVINNDTADTQSTPAPAATETAPDPAPAVVPDTAATPDPMATPNPVPQEVPAPEPEVAPPPAPAPAPAPTN